MRSYVARQTLKKSDSEGHPDSGSSQPLKMFQTLKFTQTLSS